MLTERELRKVRSLKSDARVKVGQIQWLSIGAWRIGLSCNITHGHSVRWNFSAQLLDRTHSSEADWIMLGQLSAAVDAPHDPVVPIDRMKPTDVQHWAWIDSPDGPVPVTMDPARLEAIREAVRTRPRPS
jgi:hypothetical protein